MNILRGTFSGIPTSTTCSVPIWAWVLGTPSWIPWIRLLTTTVIVMIVVVLLSLVAGKLA